MFGHARHVNREPTARSVAAEERDARARWRAQQARARRLHEGKARAAAARRRDAIAQVLRHHGDTCRCGLTVRVTDEGLRALGAGCTGPSFVCPTLDLVRRRVGL